ncbi:hypothetical protein BDR07DRAFT_431966 [Suillus spraguei]|nr:hypothetical protein BDR07DRAFT_431966 [Suillus spraguei]
MTILFSYRFESSLYKHCTVFRHFLLSLVAPSSMESTLLSRLNEARWFSYPEVTHAEKLTALAHLALRATAKTLQCARSEVRLKGGYVQTILDRFTYRHCELSGFSDQHLSNRLFVQLPPKKTLLAAEVEHILWCPMLRVSPLHFWFLSLMMLPSRDWLLPSLPLGVHSFG